MIRSSHGAARPRRLFALMIAALVLALGGCEAGFNAPTSQWHPPTDGTGIVHGDIAIRNVFVVGAPIGAAVPAGQSVGLFLALINGGSPDRLLSIAAPGVAKSVTLPGGTVALRTEQAVFLTGPAPKVILNDLTQPLAGASFIRVVMNFENAGSVALLVPVMPRAQYYTTFSPAPSPSPTASKRKGHLGASPAPGATATPGSTPSPTPTPSPTATPSPTGSG